MITREFINKALGVKDDYKIPEKLMERMMSDSEQLFKEFKDQESDLSFDWFTNYFQMEHGSKSSLKQDYTPDSLCKILAKLQTATGTVADICAGTGGLTVNTWAEKKVEHFHLEELSAKSVAFLLFNLGIRGANATIYHGDTLTREYETVYKLTNNGEFSKIYKTDFVEPKRYDTVIMNPPYSLKWEPKQDERFNGYELAPTKYSDYAFVLHGLSLLKDTGELFAIIPHGILFRGNREGEIRQKLIENNLIDAVIGLPNNMFLNTQIPVCILVLKKNRLRTDILFIDASREFIKGRKNVMDSSHIDKVVETYQRRKEIERYSSVATLETIKNNDFNLNIPRYVDNFEEEELPDILESIKELKEIDEELNKTELQLFKMCLDLEGTNDASQKELASYMREYTEMLANKYSDKTVEFIKACKDAEDDAKSKKIKELEDRLERQNEEQPKVEQVKEVKKKKEEEVINHEHQLDITELINV